MTRIFISYRRQDSQETAERIYEKLKPHFPVIFYDLNTISYGSDFVGTIQTGIFSADVVLVLIGHKWVESLHERRNNPDDFVRIEVETALEQRKRVIPILIENASMPTMDDLPERISKTFVRLNAQPLHITNPYFSVDIDKLIATLNDWESIPVPAALPPQQIDQAVGVVKRWRNATVLVTMAAVILAILAFIGLTRPNETSGTIIEQTIEVPVTEIVRETVEVTRIAEGDAIEIPVTVQQTVEVPVTEIVRETVEVPITEVVQQTVEVSVIQIATEIVRETVEVPVTQVATELVIRTVEVLVTEVIQQTVEVPVTQIVRETVEVPVTQLVEVIQTSPPTIITATPVAIPTIPLPSAAQGVNSNVEWRNRFGFDGFIQSFDNGIVQTEMILVPAGTFEMGSTNPDAEENEIPHQQTIEAPFWIAKYEVTNAEFAKFLNNNPNRNTSADGFTYIDSDDSDSNIENIIGQWQEKTVFKNHPVIEVSWFGARDYCKWLGEGFRLPTEKEWEYAASGPSNWQYPWGNGWNDNNVVWSGNSGGQTTEVGSRSGGLSWVGAYDMSGNVREWVSSLYKDYEYDETHENNTDTTTNRVLRGGSWFRAELLQLTTSNRADREPENSSNLNGFRCAYVP